MYSLVMSASMTTPQGSPQSYGQVPEKDFPWVIVGIAITLVFLVAIAGLYLVLSSLSSSSFSTPSLSTPSPGSSPVGAPVTETLPCEERCVTIEDARALAPAEDSLALLGSPSVFQEPRDGEVISEYYDETSQAFYERKGKPRGCSFDTSATPIVPSSISYNGYGDLAVDYGVWGDESRHVSQIARVFEESLYADRYRGALSGLIGRCPGYELTDPAGSVAQFVVTPITVEVSAPDVEVVAWRTESPSSTRTVVDLRYGQLAVRTSFTGASWTDQEITSYVTDTATRMVASRK